MIHPRARQTDGRAIAYSALSICYMLSRANKTDQLIFIFRRDENRFFFSTSEVLAVIHPNNISSQLSQYVTYVLSDYAFKVILSCANFWLK